MGSLAVTTCVYGEMMAPDGVDWENKKREDENNSLKTGDGRTVWCLGAVVNLHRVTDIYIHILPDYLCLPIIIAKGS